MLPQDEIRTAVPSSLSFSIQNLNAGTHTKVTFVTQESKLNEKHLEKYGDAAVVL